MRRKLFAVLRLKCHSLLLDLQVSMPPAGEPRSQLISELRPPAAQFTYGSSFIGPVVYCVYKYADMCISVWMCMHV